MNAPIRVLADEKYDSDYVNNDKDRTWQRKMNQGYHGKPRTPGQVLPEGTFSKSASEIAMILKQHSTDFKQAMSKLTSYINRSGKNLEGADKERLYSAKDSLRNAYGQQEPTTTESSSEIPVYGLPPGHNMDDGYLKTGIDEAYKPSPHTEVTDMAVPLNAATRLLSSIQNSVQDPSNDTSISHVIEADKWSQKVTDSDNKSAVPEGTFDKSAQDIASTLKRVSKDHQQAMSRLNFYANRGGANVDKSKMDAARTALTNLYK